MHERLLRDPATDSESEVMDEIHLTGNAVQNAAPWKEQVSALLSNKQYAPMLPLVLVFIGVGYMPSVFLPAYGGEWFAGCKAEEDDCELDYVTYQFYNSLFLSLRGLMSLLFAGFIGRASDAYGRKWFLFFNVFICFLPFAVLAISQNFWVFYAFYILVGLNGSNNSATPVMVAYVSDALPPNLRTTGFGFAYTTGGIGLILGAVAAIVVGIVAGIQGNLITVTILWILMLGYAVKMLPETLDKQNRKPLDVRHYNPFRPLFHIGENPIVFWIAMVQFFISLPETGVLDTLIVYILDTLEVESETLSDVYAATVLACCGIGMALANAVFLPFLKKKYSDYQVVLLATWFLIGSMVMFALVSVLKSIVTVVLGSFLISTGLMAFPAANSIVTRHVSKAEQGVAFGIIYAVRGITFMIAPFSFGYGYTLCKSFGAPYLIYVIAGLLCCLVLPVIMGPLKRTLEDTHKHNKKYTFSSMNLDQTGIVPNSATSTAHTSDDTGRTETTAHLDENAKGGYEMTNLADTASPSGSDDNETVNNV